MNEDKSLNFQIAVTGILGAISIVFSVTPFGYIQIGPLAITIMHIPVIAATVLGGLIPGIGVGLVFGISSLLRTVMLGNLWFYNPLVSIVPRVLFPVVVWLFLKLMNMIPKFPRVLSASISAAAGTFMHTLMVMSAICFIYFDSYYVTMKDKINFEEATLSLKNFLLVIGSVLATNAGYEIALAAVVTAALTGSVYIASNAKSKLAKLEEDYRNSKAEEADSEK